MPETYNRSPLRGRKNEECVHTLSSILVRLCRESFELGVSQENSARQMILMASA